MDTVIVLAGIVIVMACICYFLDKINSANEDKSSDIYHKDKIFDEETHEALPTKSEYLAEIIKDYVFTMDDKALKLQIDEFASMKDMTNDEVRLAVIKSFPLIAYKALEDEQLTHEEEETISFLCQEFKIDFNEDLPVTIQLALSKYATLRDLLEGTIKSHLEITNIPFNFQKSEVFIWYFPDVVISHLRRYRKFTAGNRGLSFRIARGIYWRTGGTAGESVPAEDIKHVGIGNVAITSRHIYYSAGMKVERIRHDKTVSVAPSENGIALFPDAKSRNPMFFQTDDDWFFLNVLQNASNWDN